MTDYIIDASVIIEYLIAGPNTADIQRFFKQLDTGDKLTVPEFCLLECTNVLWKQIRFNNMTRDDADTLLRVLRLLKLRRVPMKRLLDRALDVALKNTLAVYDSGYIALAQHYGYPLITIDQPQTRAAIAEGVRVIPLSQFK
jgi:predicted nucleic acid-binding protein